MMRRLGLGGSRGGAGRLGAASEALAKKKTAEITEQENSALAKPAHCSAAQSDRYQGMFTRGSSVY